MLPLNRLNFLTLALLAGASVALAQNATPGIRIDHQLTITKCAGCHTRDTNGMMRRISYMRTTPEVWDEAIKRMVRLNGVSLKPEEAREILRYLANNNGLAPEEAKPIFWEAEHRLFRDESDKVPDEALQHTCNYCHTIGRVLGQRRTREDYDKLINMHLGLFPGAENTLKPRRQAGPATEMPVTMSSAINNYPAVVGSPSLLGNPAPRTDGKYPADVAIDYLSKNQPLMTPEWSNWKSVMRTPKLQGKWMLVGYQQGKGRVFGTVTIEPGSTPDEFSTKTEIEYASTGATLTRTGKSFVYTGYSWRGRSTGGSPGQNANPTNPPEWREALLAGRDGNSLDGRWFWGGYQEFGFDVHLTRIGTVPMLAGVSTFAVQSPSTTELRVYGANFPAGMTSADFDFGPGITAKKIVKSTPTEVTVEVEAAANLASGIRDISVKQSTATRAISVYDKLAYIKVLPDASMARLGGGIAAKQFAQFEAIGYAAGADGKTGTADDIPVGPVAARWGTSEFISTPDDDDVKFVGSIDDSGLFTPNMEGPNPERKKQSNNYPTNNWGDIWVDATFDAPGGAKLQARSYLVVTIPVYMKYDQPEVGQ